MINSIDQKIQNLSEKLLNFALEAVTSNAILHRNGEYVCSVDEQTEIVVAFNNAYYVIFIKQEDENMFFTYNKSLKTVMVGNDREVDCAEIFNKIVNIIREKNRI